MNTRLIRQKLNLTQKEFSVIFDIPYPTVRNWDARDCMPDYVWSLLNQTIYYRKEHFINLMGSMEDPDKEFSEQLKMKLKKHKDL